MKKFFFYDEFVLQNVYIFYNAYIICMNCLKFFTIEIKTAVGHSITL